MAKSFKMSAHETSAGNVMLMFEMVPVPKKKCHFQIDKYSFNQAYFSNSHISKFLFYVPDISIHVQHLTDC